MVDHLGITTPYFGILVSLIPYIIAQYFYKKQMAFPTGTFICSDGGRNCLLKVTGISYDNYKIGGDIINFFLEAATISFAIPLYKNVKYLESIGYKFLVVLLLVH